MQVFLLLSARFQWFPFNEHKGWTVLITVGVAYNGARIQMSERGRELAEPCAVCHGSTGKADENSAVVQGLGVIPADFSDALFNSREPAGITPSPLTTGLSGSGRPFAPWQTAHCAV